MASLINIKKSGLLAVQFVAVDGSRPVVRLGRVGRKAGEVIRSHVEHLLNSRLSGQPVPRDTAAWLAEVGDELHAKLAKFGLTESRNAATAVRMGDFLDGYVKSRTDVKPRTIANLKQVRNKLVRHFTATRDVRTVTKGEMGDWHRALKETLAKATVAMHVKKARQMFQDAVDRKLIAENPVRGMKAGGMSNSSRYFYVPVEMANAVVGASPDTEWKLIFALARYQGLRVPSETNALRWTDVDWERNRMTVRAPKTEHHEGRETREVPIFPETMPHLRDAFEAAAEGAKRVIARHRGENLRTTGAKIVKRAGFEPWGKLFQNLRSSCETDLVDRFPLHVACAWIGNSEAVAKRHYLQMLDRHFETATGKSAAESAAEGSGKERKVSVQKRENPAFQQGLGGIQYPQGESNRRGIPAELRGLSKTALRKALRRIKFASPSRYRDIMALLRRQGVSHG